MSSTASSSPPWHPTEYPPRRLPQGSAWALSCWAKYAPPKPITLKLLPGCLELSCSVQSLEGAIRSLEASQGEGLRRVYSGVASTLQESEGRLEVGRAGGGVLRSQQDR